MSENNQIDRRQFIKGAGVAILSLWGLTKAPVLVGHADNSNSSENGEKGSWEQNRFFEDIGSFDDGMKEKIKTGMAEVGQKFGPRIKEDCPQIFFDEKRWEETTESALGIMGRIKKVYESLDEANELPEDAKKTLESDFYNTASVVWAMLRTAERFKDDPDGLTEAIKTGVVTAEGNFEDPFLGTEIYTINAEWANLTDAWVGGIQSKIGLFFWGGGEYYMKPVVESHWWREIKGPEALYAYAPDPQNPKRPAPFEVGVAKDPNLVGEIEEILKSEQMDRVGIEFDVINNPGEWMWLNQGQNKDIKSWGAIYMPDEHKNEHARTVKMYVPGGLTRQQMERYPYLTHAMVIHEAGHALAALAPMVKDDVKAFKNRMAIKRIIDWLKPYSDLKKYFAPKGEFFQKRNTKNGLTTATWNGRYKIINMSTITDYSSWVYSMYDLPAIGRVVYTAGALKQGVTSQEAFAAEYDKPVFRHVEEVLGNNQQLKTEPETFQDFWKEFRSKLTESGAEISSFERLVFGEIGRNLKYFDAPERQDYILRENWEAYLLRNVLPMAMKEAYFNDPEGFKMYLKRHIGNPKANSAIDHGIDLVFKKVGGENGETLLNMADQEFFAELMAYGHVRKMDGVDNEISDSAWVYIERTADNLINDLVADGLAVVPKHLPVM